MIPAFGTRHRCLTHTGDTISRLGATPQRSQQRHPNKAFGEPSRKWHSCTSPSGQLPWGPRMRAWCRYTRRRFECSHGVRFELTHGLPSPTHHTRTQKRTKTKEKKEDDIHATQHRTRLRVREALSLHAPNGTRFFLSAKSNPINVSTCFFFNSGQGSVMRLNRKRLARQYRYEPPRNCALVKKSAPSFGS